MLPVYHTKPINSKLKIYKILRLYKFLSRVIKTNNKELKEIDQIPNNTHGGCYKSIKNLYLLDAIAGLSLDIRYCT